MMIFIRCLYAVFFLFFTLHVIAKDYELYESDKCVRMFAYFEKKYKIPYSILHSISLKESGKMYLKKKINIVWPWTVNIDGHGYYFNTKQEAINFVIKQILLGKTSIDVGCMQINLKYHPDAFLSLDQAFDPKYNINYAAKFLRTKYDRLKNWNNAIGEYHSSTYILGNKYKDDIKKIAANMHSYKKNLYKKVDKLDSRVDNFNAKRDIFLSLNPRN